MKRIAESIDRYIFVFIFVVLLYLMFRIIEPFIMAIIGSALLAYIFYPLYTKLKKRVKNETLCSILMTLVIIIVITLPIIFITNAVITEAVQAYSKSKDFDIASLISRLSLSEEINSQIGSLFGNALSFLVEKTPSFLLSLPQKALNLFIMVFMLFYFFKDGEKLKGVVKNVLPKRIKKEEKLIERFKQIIFAVIYGTILISIIEGLSLTLGLFIFNGPSPFLWGAIAAVLAMLPYIGPGIVWVPIVIIKYFQGDMPNALGLFLYSTIIISFVLDTWVRALLIGDKAKLHPALTIVGVIGGLHFFGFMGFILGPLILALFVVFLEIYIGESHAIKS